MMKIAVTQYKIDIHSDWIHYANKMEALVLQAKQADAELLLLPEYAGIEIGSYHATDLELYQSLRYLDFWKSLAHRHQIYIQPGTILVESAHQQFVNRAYFFGRDQTIGYQDKLQLTAYEKSISIIKQGEEQTVFDTDYGKIAIAVCYDCEFPEIVRKLTTAGAWLILVPSYTITNAGYMRVYLSSRARALENQCYVATACVVGSVNLSGAAETAVGHAAVLSPVDIGFTDDGVVAQGVMDEVTMLTAVIDNKALETVRLHGQVNNYLDYRQSATSLDHKVILVDL